jgi:hypothetical protein
MSVNQAIERLKSAGIDIENDPIIELIDELVEYAYELGISDPFSKGDEMAWKVLDHLN